MEMQTKGVKSSNSFSWMALLWMMLCEVAPDYSEAVRERSLESEQLRWRCIAGSI